MLQLDGHRGSVGDDEKVVCVDNGDGVTTLTVCDAFELYTYEWFNYVFFTTILKSFSKWLSADACFRRVSHSLKRGVGLRSNWASWTVALKEKVNCVLQTDNL